MLEPEWESKAESLVNAEDLREALDHLESELGDFYNDTGLLIVG